MTKFYFFKIIYILPVLLILFPASSVFAQKDLLQKKIEAIADASKGTVGVAVFGLEDKNLITVNPAKHLPMQSIFKFPLALAVLKEVDKGKFSLTQKIYITKADLHPKTWSPLRDDHPDGNFDISLAELLKYTVAKSDNNGCDILFRLMGGTKKVEAYIHSLGVKDISIKATEEEMAQGWNVQYTNWSTPPAMLDLLRLFYEGKILSTSSTGFLMQTMIETSTAPNRIKGLLPKETIVAHKTGTSGTNNKGVTAATNDIGIITVNGSKHFAIVVFVSDSTDAEAAREQVIAKITHEVWNYYAVNNQTRQVTVLAKPLKYPTKHKI